jgi:hemerythrin
MSRIARDELPPMPLPFMNDDHLREIELVNDVAEALSVRRRGEGKGQGPVLAKLAVLAVQMREHFLREETAMRTSRYPGSAVHEAEHHRVLAQMDREARLFREGGDAERLSRYLFEVLPAWYRAHVRSMDAAAAEHVAARGADAGLVAP